MTRRPEGFVLVVVLWVLAILTVITISFAHRAILDATSAAYALDHAQAMMMARGAIHRGMVELQNKALLDFLKQKEWERQLEREGMEREGMEIEETRNAWEPVTHLGQPWARKTNLLQGGPYEGGANASSEDGAWYIIEDEDRYVDINTAEEDVLQGVKALSVAVRRRMLFRRREGVQEGEPPVPFHAIEEVRYIRGVSDEDWFGTKRVPGLKNVITTAGGSLININTAPPEVLRCIPVFDKSAIEAIQEYRGGGEGAEPGTGAYRGFRNLGELARATGIAEADLGRYCKLDSHFFKIYGIATRRAGKVRAVCSALVYAGDGNAAILGWREEFLGS